MWNNHIEEQFLMKTKRAFVYGIFAIIFALTFVTCGNGDEDEDSDSSNTGAMNPQGANVYFENSSLPVTGINADVFMVIDGYWNSQDDYFEMVLPTPIGKITNGKLSFTLPNVSAYADKGSPFAEELSYYNRPAGDIKTETDVGWISTSTVTKNTMEVVIPQDTKVLGGSGIGFVHQGKGYWLSYEDETAYAGPLYFNKPGTLKGEFNTTEVRTYTYNGNIETRTYNSNETCNCTFTAGWNVIYGIGIYTGGGPGSTSTSTSNMSTNPPANAATMRWIAITHD